MEHDDNVINKEEVPCLSCEFLIFGVNNCGSTVDCIHHWECNMVSKEKYLISKYQFSQEKDDLIKYFWSIWKK